MFGRTSLLKATALALPFGLAAAAAHAASIAETVQQHDELSTFAAAIAAAELDRELAGVGPYTVFAPTDQAFEQLPAGALDALMKQENQAQLTRLLEHHVVEGQAIAAGDLLGQQGQVDAMSGDTLTVDGTSQLVLLVPTGLTIARVGDQMVIERAGVAVSTRAIQVQDHAGAGSPQDRGQMPGQQAGTSTAQGADMPTSPHQRQALESQPAPDQQQTAATGTADMPATEHQQQVIQDQAAQGQGQAQGQQQAHGQMQGQGQQAGTQTTTAEGADMPASPHQQQALESQPAPDQQQAAATGTADMPATEHQQQAIQDQAAQGQGQAQGQQQARGPAQGQQSYEDAAIAGKPDLLREATVVGADIQADNGVIHVIDAVLLPQEVVKMLEDADQG